MNLRGRCRHNSVHRRWVCRLPIWSALPGQIVFHATSVAAAVSGSWVAAFRLASVSGKASYGEGTELVSLKT